MNKENTPDRSIYFNTSSQLYSNVFDDIYFSTSGAEAESEHVFINGNQLPQRFCNTQNFTIAEAGFGTGLNFLKTLQSWLKNSPNTAKLTYIAFELYPLESGILRQAQHSWSALKEFADIFLGIYPQLPTAGFTLDFPELRTSLQLYIGDINEQIATVNSMVDAWFLDGFAPSKNPEMWTDRLFSNMQRLSHSGSTTFATYSCARMVRNGLENHNFTIFKSPGFGNKKYMLQGTYR